MVRQYGVAICHDPDIGGHLSRNLGHETGAGADVSGLAKKMCTETINKFYLREKDIFQKNQKDKNDIFFKPIDIGDNTIPNGNAIMLINLIRLGFTSESKKLANSLSGYLNIYKNHMMTAIRALDFFNNIQSRKSCNEQGCKPEDIKT